MLAVRAVAMAAGVWHQRAMITCRALRQHPGAGLRAAVLYRRQRPRVLSGKPVPIVSEKVGPEGVDDCSEADHLTLPQATVKPSIRLLMRSMAWCLV